MQPSHSESGRVLEALVEMEENRETVCEFVGHEWQPAGGGLLVCVVCTAEKWEGERG